MSVEIRPYRDADQGTVVKLWNDCALVVPANDPVKDIQRKLKVNPELFLVAESSGEIVGTVMGGYEGHRGWVNYLAVAPSSQGAGIGRLLMAGLEGRLAALGCPKINLQIRETNAAVRAFYEKIGYAQDRVVSYGKRLAQD